MRAKEKQLLTVLVAMLLVALVIKGVPWLKQYYQDGQQNITQLQQRITRYQRLIEDTELWQEREALKTAETADYENWIFAADAPNQVGVSVQRALRQVAEQHGIQVRETPVAKYSFIDDWLKVSQEMNFSVQQEQILPFIQALNSLQPKLYVTAFKITRNRRLYLGEITVVGFSPVQQKADAEKSTLK